MKKMSLSKFVGVAFGALVIVGLLVWLVLQVVLPRVGELPAFVNIRANAVVVDFHVHFNLDPGVTQVVFEGERLRYELPPLVEFEGGEAVVYFRADFLRDFVDPFVFWDVGAGALFVSTAYEMLEFSPFVPHSSHVLVNGSPRALDRAVRHVGGEIFVPACVVMGLYPLIVEFHEEYNMVVIVRADLPQTTAVVSVDSADVRFWPAERAPITAQVARGGVLTLFPDFESVDDIDGSGIGNYVRVRTGNGLLGYVLISDIEGVATAVPLDTLDRDMILGRYIDNWVHPERVWQGDGGVNLLWDSIYHPDANRVQMQTPLHDSVNVISPTWFRIDPEGTHLNSVASREYVDWAHSQGVEVWPLVFDVWYDRSRLFLQNRDARRHAVEQLIGYVELLNLDGINIDFEYLRAADGPYKIQFLRELAIPMRERGVVLSAAVKVPLPATAFYRRDLIGKTVDFVMVMTYDEFWATAPETGHGHGPNASLPFVRRGVDNMLDLVPADRLVMGIPFYNRIWRETMATGEVRHHAALGTNSTRAFFEERNVSWVWDFETGTYFGEVSGIFEGETVIFRVWLEDARSVQEKMHIFYDNRLAGVAAWSRFFEIPEFWDVIGRYF